MKNWDNKYKSPKKEKVVMKKEPNNVLTKSKNDNNQNNQVQKMEPMTEVDKNTIVDHVPSQGISNMVTFNFEDRNLNIPLSNLANSCKIIYNQIRKIPIDKFPYKVIFRIDENKQIVYIEGITCDYEDPYSKKIKL